MSREKSVITQEGLTKLDDCSNTENWEWQDEVWCRSQGMRILISAKTCYFFLVSGIEGNLAYLSPKIRLSKMCGCMPSQHAGVKIRELGRYRSHMDKL